MTRRERIVVLLENYIDVVNGLQEWRSGSGELIALMCRAWNHPSYRELERLRVVMRDSEPDAYWHLAETYFRFQTRRAAICPKCGRLAPAALIDEFCHHGKRRHHQPTIRIATTQKVISRAVRPTLVMAGIGWLEDNWRGEPFIPDDLLANAA